MATVTTPRIPAQPSTSVSRRPHGRRLGASPAERNRDEPDGREQPCEPHHDQRTDDDAASRPTRRDVLVSSTAVSSNPMSTNTRLVMM